MHANSYLRQVFSALIAVLGLAASATVSQAVTEAAPEADTLSLTDALRNAIDARAAAVVPDAPTLRTFYETRGFLPLWVGVNGLTPAGSAVVAEIGKAAEWGLDPLQFTFTTVGKPSAGAPSVTSAGLAAAELEVTSMVLKYASHARGGRITDPSAQLSSYLDRRPQLIAPDVVLSRMASASKPAEALTAFNPHHTQFLRLKAYLAAIRGDQAVEASKRIAERGPELRSGARSEEVRALRARLEVAAPDAEADLFDAEVFEAVKKFQRAKSLRADGIVGRGTRRALNGGGVSGDKTKAVIANMEQWRWMPDDLGSTYAFVNVPSFTVDLISNGQSTFRERVIVGTTETQTPIFSHEMRTIVVRPEWNLPDSIKIKKVVAAGGNGRTLESHGYRIRGKNGQPIKSSRVNWSRADLSKYSIYQPSGGDNALGLVKFLFPNKHSVYLHDTPSKDLFQSSERLFSHGCVRVKNPLSFAQHLFDADKGPGAVDAVYLSKKGPFNNQIPLTSTIPVHITYFTVWIGDDGQAEFMADAYGHQRRIVLALDNRWSEIDKGKNHLDAVDMDAYQDMIVSRRAAKRSRTAAGAPVLTDAAGVTTVVSGYKYRPSSNSVGDIIRRAIGN